MLQRPGLILSLLIAGAGHCLANLIQLAHSNAASLLRSDKLGGTASYTLKAAGRPTWVLRGLRSSSCLSLQACMLLSQPCNLLKALLELVTCLTDPSFQRVCCLTGVCSILHSWHL